MTGVQTCALPIYCSRRLVHLKETVWPDRRIIASYQGHYFTWHQMYPALKGIYQQML